MWTPEEQAEHRRLWVEALRSGEYKQSTMQLRTVEGFCCLGVACDLYKKVSSFSDWNENTFVTPDNGGTSTRYSLPTPVQDWLGLRDDCGAYTDNSLASDNDHGKSFNEIADIIEKEPEGLIAP